MVSAVRLAGLGGGVTRLIALGSALLHPFGCVVCQLPKEASCYAIRAALVKHIFQRMAKHFLNAFGILRKHYCGTVCKCFAYLDTLLPVDGVCYVPPIEPRICTVSLAASIFDIWQLAKQGGII